PPGAPDATPVAAHARVLPLARRLSMDILPVDPTAPPQAQVGDPVELWGAQVSIDAVAEAAGTVGYELMCAVAARVPVRVVDGAPAALAPRPSAGDHP
ncbi:MAG: alanine racemase C-terminal domain-containing protein, partial [Betaproteobacteria bacterium]